MKKPEYNDWSDTVVFHVHESSLCSGFYLNSYSSFLSSAVWSAGSGSILAKTI